MTMRRRTTIDPRDILALEYECGKCHVRYSVPLALTAGIPRTQTNCPNCQAEWIRGSDAAESAERAGAVVSQFIRYLYALQSARAEAIIRLEISTPYPEGDESGKIKA